MSGDLEVNAWKVAKPKALVAEGLAGLADIDAGLRQGNNLQELPVYLELFCSQPRITIGSKTYTVGVSRVIVRLDIENADIIARYEGLRLQSGDIDILSEALSQEEGHRKTSRGFSLSGQLDGSGNALGGGLGIKAFFGFENTKSQTASTNEKRVVRPEITIIGTNGIDGFAFGDFHYGDPRRPLQLLSDSYKCVNEGSGAAESEEFPIITLKCRDQQSPITIRFSSYIPTNRLWIKPDGSGNASRKEKRRISEDLEGKIELLRQQMIQREFGEMVGKHQEAEGFPRRDGEFIVYSRTIVVEPLA